MALTKVTEQVLLAPTQTASSSITVGGAVDASAYYAADVRIRMGRNSTVAFTVGPTARLEGTYASTSGNANQWTVLAAFQAAVGSNIAGQALSTAAASNSTAFQLAAGTNFAAGDYAYVHEGTATAREWVRIYAMSGATALLEQGTAYAHASGTVVYDQAEQYHALVDLTCIQKLRLVIDGQGSAVAVVHAAEFGAVQGL